MRTHAPIPARSRESGAQAAAQAAGDTQALDWLKRMGVVVVDEFGAWRLSELGERAMNRFNQSSGVPCAATPAADF